MTNRAEFERLLDVYGFRCERFGQDLSTHARAQVVSAFAALASAPVAGEAQKPVAWLHQCRKKPELATVTMNKRKPALAAKGYRPIPLYAAPQASEAVDRSPNLQGSPVDRSAELQDCASEAVRDALQKLVDMYVLNQGSDHEHITCYTPLSASHLTPKQRAKSETWKAWDDARAALSAQPGAQRTGGSDAD